MLSSGLVSEPSLQYQLKHLNRVTTRYYGQNYYKLKSNLDQEAKGYYLKEMYNTVAREFRLLQEDRYVSPHGEKRKAQILSEISDKDHSFLVKAATDGRITYRETFFGGCMKPGAVCPLGGICNVTGCLGHGERKPCEWVVVDRKKRPKIVKLQLIFERQMAAAPQGSALRASLEASMESTNRALHVIDTV